MTVALTTDWDRRKITRSAAALAFVVAGIDVLLGQARIRTWEAGASAQLGSWSGLINAESLGSSVIFPLDGRSVGYTLTTGCTVALLVAPFFFLLAGVMVAGPKISIRRAVFTLFAISGLLFLVNQLRLLAVAGAMRAWGFETGYERGHVLLGTTVSTLGLVGALLVFILILTRGQRNDRSGDRFAPLDRLRHRWPRGR